MKTEKIRGKISAVTIVVCSLWIGAFSFTLDAVADEATMYELTVTVVSGHGTVEPNSGSYSAGTVVTLTAKPEVGYNMRQWADTDDDTSCGLTNTVTMVSDKTVTVEFGLLHLFKVPSQYNMIQDAIDAAGCGDVVVVGAGVYYEDINFNGKDIRVTSTNPDDPMCVESTIIQGTGAGPVVTFSGTESQSCVLDGLTITGGNTAGDGGGICGNGTEATIANCVITNNHADGYGGGVSDCNGTIEHCTITGNTADSGGGGMSNGSTWYEESSHPRITNCTFIGNRAAHGGGMFNEYSYPTLTNCVFIGNSADGNGGGMYNSSNPRLINCTFSGNSAEYYGGIWNYPPPPGDGGVSSVGGSSYIVTNNFLSGNIVTNCIIWGNSDSRGMDESAQIGTFGIPLIVNYSCVQGWTGGLGGIGNIGEDPLFVDADGVDNIVGTEDDNLRLLVDSPCIDTGDNSVVTFTTDLDGNPRIRGNAVDIGAYEAGITYHVDCVNGDNTNDGLTKETAFKTIQRGINIAEDCDTVLVWPGVYNEEIAFWGDAITVKSAADAAVVETDYGYAFSFFSAEGPDTVLSNFVIRNSQYGIYLINGSSPTLRNLTIVNNDFGISAFNGADPDISSCIFWNNYYGDLFRDPVPLQARYSCIEEGGEGEGNISIDPGFVDANGGDYHLLSERGRYWPAHHVWVLDEVTSPCVDGGDPAVDPSNERMPNGGRINMGAYGNTAYASMSDWPLKHDSNFDGVVNMLDFAELALEWLETITVIPEPNDVTPPAPVPAIIIIGAVSSSSIMMTASESYDESGVQYYFEALSAGGHDSGWLDEPNYTDVNLVFNTIYCYRVKARDKSANYNETIWSPSACTVTVIPPDTLPPLPDPMQWDPVVDANGYDGRPLEVYLELTGDYGATMRAIDADDQAPTGGTPTEVEYYFYCVKYPNEVGKGGFSSGWRTVGDYPDETVRRTYTVRIGTSGQMLQFRVKARDTSASKNETEYSTPYSADNRLPP